MIARLRGTVVALEEGHCVLDVGGVGYLVFASSRTLRDLRAGAEATLSVETQVREDAINLYGFVEATERRWFSILTTVQGVGAKVALAILSTLAPDELARAIAAADRTALSRTPGVGPKLAARLATELKDKAAEFGIAPVARAVGDSGAPAAPAAGVNEDAVSALVNLGYRRADAYGAIAKVAQRLGGDAKLDQLIRGGLQELGRA
jgi:Holliday junction DNA helicase RuvA